MHLTGVEEFELPTKEQFLYLGLNGLIGTVIIWIRLSLPSLILLFEQVVCELIWIYACFLTSPLQGTLALSLINPGSILADYVSFKTFFIFNTDRSYYITFRLVNVSFLVLH